MSQLCLQGCVYIIHTSIIPIIISVVILVIMTTILRYIIRICVYICIGNNNQYDACNYFVHMII